MRSSEAFDVVLTDGQRVEVRRVQLESGTGWAAFAPSSPDPVGTARLISRSKRGSAQMLVMVAPAYRERGLGKILFDTLLMSSLEHGFDRVQARVMANSWLARKLRGQGAPSDEPRTSGNDLLEVSLEGELARLHMSGPMPKFQP